MRRPFARTTTTLIGLTCAAALTLSACTSDTETSVKSAPATAIDGPITIVASTNVWGSVAEAVAGDLAQVKSLIADPSADPHSYEASAGDAATVAEASLVVYNGGGYDSFVEEVLGSAGKNVPSVNAFDLLEDSHGHDGSENSEAGDDGHSHGDVNEHVFYDPEIAAATAESIAEKLGQLDPDNAAKYTANAEVFHDQMHEITDETAKIAADHPNAPVAQTEPIAHYLIENSGLDDKTPEDFKNALEAGNDPSPASIAATRDLLTSKSVQALVYNTQTEDSVTRDIRSTAEAAGVPVVEVTETLPEGMTYVEWQKKAAGDLLAALDAS